MKIVKFSEVKIKQHFFGTPSNHEYVKINETKALCFQDSSYSTFNKNNLVKIAEPKRNLLDRKNPVYAYVGDTKGVLKKRIVENDKRIITHDLGEFGCLAVAKGSEQIWLAGESTDMVHWKFFKYCDEVDEKEPEYLDWEDVLDFLNSLDCVWEVRIGTENQHDLFIYKTPKTFPSLEVYKKSQYRILDKETKQWSEWKEFLKGGENE